MSNRTIGRRTREQIERWNQMTAMRFQGETSEEPGLSSGLVAGEKKLKRKDYRFKIIFLTICLRVYIPDFNHILETDMKRNVTDSRTDMRP